LNAPRTKKKEAPTVRCSETAFDSTTPADKVTATQTGRLMCQHNVFRPAETTSDHVFQKFYHLWFSLSLTIKDEVLDGSELRIGNYLEDADGGVTKGSI
jgi:hypothetical protein